MFGAKIYHCLFASLLASAFIGLPMFANSHTFTVEVKSISEMSVSGDPQTLALDNSSDGTGTFKNTSDSSTTYSISINGQNKRITGSIDLAMPNFTQLEVALAAANGASSAGNVLLNTNDQTLVSNVTENRSVDQKITYTFSAYIDQVQEPTILRVVTFSIADM